MKPKTFYILMIISSLSLFSSAKQAGKCCDKKTCCGYSKQKCLRADLDMPPMQLIFGI